jgi:O-antigen ligase
MKKAISILLAALIFLLPLGLPIFGGIYQKHELILCSCIFLLLILFSYIVFLIITGKRLSVSISILDTSVLLFFVYSVFNLLFVRNLQISEVIIYKWISSLCIYALCRIVLHKNTLMYAIVLSGFVQSIIAVLQKLYIIDSYSIFFDVTGTLQNPGRLGGYVAVAFVSAIYLLHVSIKNKSYLNMSFLFVASSFLFTALILADSRAAFVGVLCGVFIYFYPKFHHICKKHKIMFTTAFSVLSILIGLLLFNYRQGSASSRLLIWRVSADMILDKPLPGHGITSFDQKYMHYQAEYFNKNPNSRFIPVADNVAYAYNEFIHVTVEMGILGLLLLSFIFYSALSGKKQQSQKAALGVLLALAMFSYPTEIFPILILFSVIIGCIKTKILLKIHLRRSIFILIGIILLYLTYINFKSELYFRNASLELVQTQESKQQTEEYICKYYKRLKYNIEFCRVYVIWLNDNNLKDEIFNVLELFPTSENYCLFGDRYVQNRMFGKAEECFKTADLMTPNRILPNYNLFKLYRQLGDNEKTILMANKILKQHIKIDNTQTIRIQFEVENYLRKLNLINPNCY